ncbi:hypothetical protein LEP1GSC104_4364 [Leptospira interrogans str. UI 12621]|uniref:Uncharacterized protein n=1 Tax=Leptospira interrogans str. UI 12621 TaxID=1049937 RepID=A0A0F6H5E9_LEPIR|nr:hypothetical protein LEP1GSC104_4364 [Leptospira interrogans str. UI 12621]
MLTYLKVSGRTILYDSIRFCSVLCLEKNCAILCLQSEAIE